MSADVREIARRGEEELAALPVGRACCARAEILGMSGVLGRGGIDQVSWQIASRAGAARLHRLLGTYMQLRARARESTHGWELSVHGPGVGNQCGIVDRSGTQIKGMPVQLTHAKACCARASLGAIVLAGGEWKVPRSAKASVHVRMRSEAGLGVQALGRRVGARLSRDEGAVVARGAELETLLEALECRGTAQLVREHHERMKLPPGERRVSLVNANQVRIQQAASAQAEAVERVLSQRGVRVPEHLAEAGRARLRWPEDSLEMLGRRLSPPVSKDAIAGRLRRLLALEQQAG